MAALEKELEQLRQRSPKNPHSKRQMRRRRQRTKWRSGPLGQLQTAGLFPEDHPAIKSLKAPARGFEQARTRSPCMGETSKHSVKRGDWLLGMVFFCGGYSFNCRRPCWPLPPVHVCMLVVQVLPVGRACSSYCR